MLIIEQGKVYRLDEEVLTDLLGRKAFQSMIEDTHALIDGVGEDIEDDCITYIEFKLRTRAARNEDEDIRKAYHKLYSAIWEQFKGEADDLSKHLVDMKPEEVEHTIHGEPGLGFDMDKGLTIECHDCESEA